MADIYLNEDSSHYFMTRAEKASDPTEIKKFIMQYANTNVEKIILCANAQKTNFPTKTGTIAYENVTADEQFAKQRPVFMNWINAVRDVVEKGIDIYSIWIDTAREAGISPWLSMRMNDVHNADDVTDPIHGEFFKKHPEYRLAPHRDRDWHDRQFNYLIKEVRDYHFAIVEEYFEKYDFDGFELDWMRFANHFPPGYEDAGREVLDEFMKNTRLLADEYEKSRGHAIGIGARVPLQPETAFDMGMDGVGWALAGYVDYIAPSPFWHTSQADIPVERWKRQVKGTGCKITPCIEICLRPYAHPKCKNESPFNSLDTMKAAAQSYVDRGADAVYLFNYMDSQEFVYDDETYERMLRVIGNPKEMKKGLRRHILTFSDRQPEGTVSDERLPALLEKKSFYGFRLHTGNMQDKEKRLAILAFKDKNDIGPDDLKVFVNTYECAFHGMVEGDKPVPMSPLFAWQIPEAAFKNGYQVIELCTLNSNLTLDWVEMSIQS